MFRAALTFLLLATMPAIAAGCGSSSSTSSASSSANSKTTPGTTSQTATATTSGSSLVGTLSAEAKSAATGDIPDTQVFLTYSDPSSGYGIAYPEGWTRRGSSKDITFSNNNNLVHIVITNAGAPTPASVASELGALKRSNPTLMFAPPKTIQVKAGPAVQATYTTTSAPNPVTGKTVLLIVDRYELSKTGKRATVDLGTPKGVDNVDAYRLMINSFHWQ